VRILGEWSGAYSNKDGEKILATMTYYEGGIRITEVTLFGMSFSSEWWFEGDRMYFISELSPEKTNFRDVEFIADDVMRTTKEESDVVETWKRVEDD